MKYLIGLDLGSGSIRAGAFGLDGVAAAIAARPSLSIAPDPAKTDHLVWPESQVWNTVCEVCREVIAALPANAEISGVAAACLGMDGVPIDVDGNALYDFIAWTDNRCVSYYEKWLHEFGEDRQFLTTGTPARGFSTLFRLQWMADNHPEILEKTHKWVLMGDYINYRLCGTLATDYSMAACTLLFDPANNNWHEGIARAANVDLAKMCDPHPSTTRLGEISSTAAATTGLPVGTPVILGGHDYLCGVLPVGGFKPGPVVNVGGTWDVIQTTLPKLQIPKAAAGTGWTIEPHVAPGQYSAFGAAVGGAVVNWFRDCLAPDLANDEASFQNLATLSAGRHGGAVMFLPHLAGATGPVVDASAAGAFAGLRPEHRREDLLAAIFEGLNFQTRQILATAQTFGASPDRLIFVGGSSRNTALAQSKANIMNMPVEVPQIAETTCLGAAMLVGIGIGQFANMQEAHSAIRPPSTTLEPEPDKVAVMNERFAIFESFFNSMQETHASLSTVF